MPIDESTVEFLDRLAQWRAAGAGVADLGEVAELRVWLGRVLRERRELSRWTLLDAADLTGVDAVELHHLEAGTAEVAPQTVVMLARRYGLDETSAGSLLALAEALTSPGRASR